MAKQQIAATILGVTISCAATAAANNKPMEAVVVATAGAVVVHLASESKETDDSK